MNDHQIKAQPDVEMTHGNPCPGCGCPYPGDHTQECHWEKDEAVLRAFESIRDTIKNLADAVSELHKIAQHQQNVLGKLLKHETDQPI